MNISLSQHSLVIVNSSHIVTIFADGDLETDNLPRAIQNGLMRVVQSGRLTLPRLADLARRSSTFQDLYLALPR